jgi:hypothetical protein
MGDITDVNNVCNPVICSICFLSRRSGTSVTPAPLRHLIIFVNNNSDFAAVSARRSLFCFRHGPLQQLQRFQRAAIQPQQPLCSNGSFFFSLRFFFGFSDSVLQQQHQLILRCSLDFWTSA